MKSNIKYVVLVFFGILSMYVLSEKVSSNITHVKNNFESVEAELLHEFSINITELIKENIKDNSLYDTLMKNNKLMNNLEYSLAVIVSKKYKYAYVVEKHENAFRFLLDGSLSDTSIIGEKFYVTDRSWFKVYETKKSLTFQEGGLEDIGMTFLFPIIIDDEVKAVLAIDFSKKRIKETMSYLYPMEEMINYALIALSVIISLLIISVVLWLRKNEESNIRKIELEKNELVLQKATQEAQTASVAKSEFLANMSHEIRTPMNAIIGLSDLVSRTSLDKKQMDYVDKIRKSSSSLLSIINDILDFSKIEAGKLELEHKFFAIEDIIGRIRALFNTTTDEDSLAFEIFLGEGLPSFFVGDVIRIEQVIINMLSNAFKFTTTGSIKLHINYDASSVYNINIIVKDTGIGIPEDKQDKLFSDFVQADSSVTREFGGTGLGLSISKQIVELLGGTIELESEVGVGTTFNINVNLEVYKGDLLKEKVFNLASIRNELLKYSDVNILIAEDNLINQDVIVGYLEEFDFNVTLVQNGQECVDEMQNRIYDLILMDINMPIMGGYKATKKIRMFNEYIPIVALSANARNEDTKLSLKAGMNDHIGKPIDPKILYQSLQKFVPIAKKSESKIIAQVQDEVEIESLDDESSSLDIQKAIEMLNDNQDLYKKIIKRYYDSYSQCLFSIDSMSEDEHKDFFHQLKGVCSSVGARRLFDLVEEYYTLLQNKQKDDNLLEKIKDEIIIVNREVEVFLSIDASKQTSSISSTVNADVDEIILEFKTALQTKKSKLIKESFSKFEVLVTAKGHAGSIEKLKSAIDSYNFKKALQILEDI